MIDQITVFLENSKGRLSDLCRCLSDAGIDMHALTIADTADYGIVRIIADDPAAAVTVLSENDCRATLTKVTAVGVPNSVGGLADLLDLLDAQDVNVEYGYCFSMFTDTAVDVFKIRDEEAAAKAEAALAAAGCRILTDGDLA